MTLHTFRLNDLQVVRGVAGKLEISIGGNGIILDFSDVEVFSTLLTTLMDSED